MDTSFSVLSESITKSDCISDEMLMQYLIRFSEKIEAISLTYTDGICQVRVNGSVANVVLIGVNEGYKLVENIRILEGRFINDSDLHNQNHVAVVSDKLVSKLFSINEDVLGMDIEIDTIRGKQIFSIIGVYECEQATFSESDAEFENYLQTNLLIPHSNLNKR